MGRSPEWKMHHKLNRKECLSVLTIAFLPPPPLHTFCYCNDQGLYKPDSVTHKGPHLLQWTYAHWGSHLYLWFSRFACGACTYLVQRKNELWFWESQMGSAAPQDSHLGNCGTNSIRSFCLVCFIWHLKLFPRAFFFFWSCSGATLYGI